MAALRFLADESCDHAVVRALRAAGHDVTAAAEEGQRTVDSELISRAHAEERVLLTEDKDFGWLVLASRNESAAVILIPPASPPTTISPPSSASTSAAVTCNACRRSASTLVSVKDFSSPRAASPRAASASASISPWCSRYQRASSRSEDKVSLALARDSVSI